MQGTAVVYNVQSEVEEKKMELKQLLGLINLEKRKQDDTSSFFKPDEIDSGENVSNEIESTSLSNHYRHEFASVGQPAFSYDQKSDTQDVLSDSNSIISERNVYDEGSLKRTSIQSMQSIVSIHSQVDHNNIMPNCDGDLDEANVMHMHKSL